MTKKRSGPDGPDHTMEPPEIAASEAASKQITESLGSAQQGADVASAESGSWRGSDGTLFPPYGFMYDSGWEDCSGIAVRVVFTVGPFSRAQRDFVRALMLRPLPSPGGRTEADR